MYKTDWISLMLAWPWLNSIIYWILGNNIKWPMTGGNSLKTHEHSDADETI